jgi:hypothetical protein
MAWTHIQGKQANVGVTSTIATVVLDANPTPGNLVCVVLGFEANGVTPVQVSLTSIKDSNNNSYTPSTSSPKNGDTNAAAGSCIAAYLLKAPANATKTITATYTVANGTLYFYDGAIWADEFSYTGTASFDKDATGTANSGAGINTPAITPTNSGELVYVGCSAPAGITAVGVGWTESAGGHSPGAPGGAEYLLSSSGTATTGMTGYSLGYGWNTIAMAFKTTVTTNLAGSLCLLGCGNA